MLHRVKKDSDPNKGKWVGIGGKVEPGETVEQCLVREVFEETGLILDSYSYRGVVDFVSDIYPEEMMHLFTASVSSPGPLGECREGELAWVDIDKISSLPMWEGDSVFIDLIKRNEPFFNLRLVYSSDSLVSHDVSYPQIR